MTENLFGDILSDLGAGLQGGLGTAASGNIHLGDARCSSPYTAQHRIWSARQANPMAAVRRCDDA